MGKYIGSTGLAYLWGKIKATFYQKPSGGIPKSDLSSAVQTSLGKADTALQSHQDISGKVDKVTSTDNAVVRFNGTSGAVQNSGVTIDDSNNVTAAKFVTKNGTSSQFVKGDGSLDSTVYATKTSDDNKVPYGGVLMPTNSFGGKKVYINSMDNAFNAADQKYYVTITKHSKSANGITYPYVDSTKEATDDDYYVDGPIISTLTTWAHRLFSGDYETYLGCGADEYIKIRIMFGSNTSPSATTSYFSGYPYGNFYISYYSNRTPNIASQCRIYNKYSAQGVGWKLLTATAFTGTLNASSFIERVSDESDYRRTCVEFIIFGNDVSGRDVYITQIDYQLVRPFLGRDGSTVTKFDEQSLYFPFNWYNDHTKTVTINNNGNITAVKFIKSGGTSSQFLKADGSVDSNTYLTQSTFNSGNPDLKAIEALSGTSGLLKKTAANTWSLDTNTYLTQGTFDSGNPDLKAIEAITGTTGLLKKTAANTWALDTTAYLTQSTFESGNPDLKAIEAISGTTGLLKKTAANTWTLDTTAYLTQSSFNSGNQDLAAIEALTGNAGLLKKTGANTWALDTTAYLKGSDVDSVPTAGSTKPVSSGGVHTAIAEESAARQSGDSSLSTQVSAKADKMAQVNHGTSDTTFVLTPNVLHVWDEVTSLTLTLGTGETGIVNEYLFEFHSGNTPTVLTLPSSVLWVRPLTVQAGKSYQVSIVNNLACYLTDGMGIEESQGSTPVYATQSWVTSLIEQAPAANSSKVPQSGGVYAALEGGYYAS